jgi:hypothetical protein
MTRHILLAVLAGVAPFAVGPADAGPDAAAEPVPSTKAASVLPAGAVTDVPIVVAGKWLAALRVKDATTIGALSASPFLIDGFDSMTGPVRDKCKERAEGGPKARWIRLRAESKQALDDILVCLFIDQLLVTSIPTYAPDGWPTTSPPPESPPPARPNTGSLKVVEPAKIAKRLARYKKDIRALASGHTLVEANFTDNNGVTVHALLPVKRGQVTAFLSDEKFEH